MGVRSPWKWGQLGLVLPARKPLGPGRNVLLLGCATIYKPEGRLCAQPVYWRKRFSPGQGRDEMTDLISSHTPPGFTLCSGSPVGKERSSSVPRGQGKTREVEAVTRKILDANCFRHC